MWRNISITHLIFFVPVMQFLLFCMAFKPTPTNFKIAIVNHEVDYMNMSYQACQYPTGCKLSHLSCRYIQHLKNDTLQKLYYPDTKSAVEAVGNSDVWGVLYMTENFTDALVARWILGNDADEETLDQSEVKVWLDVSDQHNKTTLQQDLQLSYQSFFEDLLEDCGRDSFDLSEIKNPVTFKSLVSDIQ